VELVEGAEASVSPKVATVEAAGSGRRGRRRRRQRRSRVASEIEGKREEREEGQGWVTDLDPSRVSLTVLEWASLSQLASWAKKALAINLNKISKIQI
jgi:hypothetical protein